MPGTHTRRLVDRERTPTSEMPTESASVDFVLKEHKMVMRSLYESKEGADLALACNSTTFRVHSFLLKPRSKFFAAACEGEFLEAASKRIELPDDYVGSVGRMVCYCYLMDYPDVKAQETLVEASYISRAHANAQVYALAEKYDIEGLKVLARTKFDAAMVAEFDPVPLTSPPDMTHLIAILSLVYNSTPGSDRVLRDRVIGHMWKHWKRLTPEPEFHALIAANPELMIEAVNNMFGQQLQ